jgi:hypothetical protein
MTAPDSVLKYLGKRYFTGKAAVPAIRTRVIFNRTFILPAAPNKVNWL